VHSTLAPEKSCTLCIWAHFRSMCGATLLLNRIAMGDDDNDAISMARKQILAEAALISFAIETCDEEFTPLDTEEHR